MLKEAFEAALEQGRLNGLEEAAAIAEEFESQMKDAATSRKQCFLIGSAVAATTAKLIRARIEELIK